MLQRQRPETNKTHREYWPVKCVFRQKIDGKEIEMRYLFNLLIIPTYKFMSRENKKRRSGTGKRTVLYI